MRIPHLLKRFQKHVQGTEYWGVDVFDDGTVQVYHEINPRDGFDQSCTIDEFMEGRYNGEVELALGEEKLRDILVFLAERRASSRD
jgi:hypothetical protein